MFITNIHIDLDIYTSLCTYILTFCFSDFRCTGFVDASTIDPSMRGKASQAHYHWLGVNQEDWRSICAQKELRSAFKRKKGQRAIGTWILLSGAPRLKPQVYNVKVWVFVMLVQIELKVSHKTRTYHTSIYHVHNFLKECF